MLKEIIQNFLYLIIVIEAIWFGTLYFDMNIIYKLTFGEILNALILAGTAFIVWKYTREAQRSNDINEKPILNLYLRENNKEGLMPRKFFSLRNVGNGPAYNINISRIDTEYVSYTPDFRQANFILERERDERTIMFKPEKHDGGVELFEDYANDLELFVDRVFPRNTKPEDRNALMRVAGMFLINYEGVNGKAYYSIFRIYPRSWPLINVYDIAIEFVKNGIGKLEIDEAISICKDKDVLLADN